MNTSQITEALAKFYDSDGHRIVFWNDPHGEFLESLGEIIPDGVALIRPDQIGTLSAKIQIEVKEPKQKFLVYTPAEQPSTQDDWLLDVRLYSRTFAADSSSLLLTELGLESQQLRGFLATRKNFFASKDRLAKFKRWVTPNDTERDLDKKMIAVVAGAEQPDVFSILLKLFSSITGKQSEATLLPGLHGLQNMQPPAWKDITKLGLEESFWQIVQETFGYASPEPKISDLLIRLFVSELALHASEGLPTAVRPLVLADRSGVHNASVFLANWRSNTNYLDAYAGIARMIQGEIELSHWINNITASALADNETFDEVERRILRDVRDRVLAPLPADTTELQSLINIRKGGYWCRRTEVYCHAYDAVSAALDFYKLRDKYKDSFSFQNAGELFRSYTTELYLFDQYYRLFNEAAQHVRTAGLDLLKAVVDDVEKVYGNWYLERLGTTWGACLEHEDLLKSWKLDDVPNQYRFYDKFVKPRASNAKVYVIVSDAFRYECAEELMRELNKIARDSGNAAYQAELNSMLGVLPSYTALGMASLLPHGELDYKVKASGLDVTIDGRSTSGIDNRKAILNEHNAVAIKADDLIGMTRQEGRDFVRDQQVIYIYHDVIDATGDKASTEDQVFEAVRKTINDLSRLVAHLFNLNGSYILITADHGFLYQQTPPQDLDRSSLDISSDQAKLRKKRYVIDPQIPARGNAWHGRIKNTAKITSEMEFLIPKGAKRFHFVGGAKFVHGGAMPQEIVVPVVEVKKLTKTTAPTVKRVGVTLLNNVSRIVNNVQRLEFIQTEAVSERVLPRTLKISLRDGEGALISNEVTVKFESSSNSMDDRVKAVQLILRTGDYDRTGQYYLLLEDPDRTVKEYQRIPVTIDIAFTSDF